MVIVMMAASLWPAPTASAPVDATVVLPGSKSVTNRALVLSALATGPSLVRRPLRSRDTLLMADGLRTLGTRIEDLGEDWRVVPEVLRGPATIDVGNAGTVMRFLLPVATLAEGAVSFDGDERARQRPVGPLLCALVEMGAEIDDGGRQALPLLVEGRGRLAGGRVTLDASSSSQLISALLLAGPRCEYGIEIRHVGPPVPSLPHIEMTVQMLRAAGADVDSGEADVWRVRRGELQTQETVVEPDLSNAAPFLAAALVTGGRITVPDWPRSTTQPGDALRALFSGMGAACAFGPGGLTLEGSSTVAGIDADLHEVGELTPVVAAVAALASGPSRLRGVAHLRSHETDRLAALAHEINGLGGDVSEMEDGLEIRPRPLRGGVFHTYEDHRLAMAAAVVGLVVPGVKVENVATTAKTLPTFPELWARMLQGVAPAAGQ